MTGWERLCRSAVPSGRYRLSTVARAHAAALGANVHQVRRVLLEGAEVWRAHTGVARLQLDDLQAVVRMAGVGIVVTQVCVVDP